MKNLALPTLLRLLCAGLLWSGLVSTARALDIMPHSLSRSRQFVVYAKDGALRGAVGTVGDDTKDAILHALGQQDEWKIPVVVDLRAPEPGLPDAHSPVRLSFGQTGTGLKIELDLQLGDAARGTRIRDELVRTLLLEMAYRNYDGLGVGTAVTLPPPWLVEGFSAYVDNVEDGVSASMFAALLPTTQTMPISDFLARDPSAMDSTSRAVYRAYSYNLVSLLLQDVEGGRAGMLSFIHDLPKLPAEEARSAGVLAQHFSQLAASPDGLEKWWTLGLARLASTDQFHPYSVQETEEHLVPLLSFQSLPDFFNDTATTEIYTLDDFEEFTGHKQNKGLLEGARRGLVELSGRANPLSRPIILGYQEVVQTLAQEHTKGVAVRLQTLAAERKRVLKARDGIADYLNWYEATQVSDQSGDFENYFRTAKQLAQPQTVHRPDAISTYLDGLEMEYR